MDNLLAVLAIVLAIAAGIGMDMHKANQCERNGLGEWHTLTQVCEPVRP